MRLTVPAILKMVRYTLGQKELESAPREPRALLKPLPFGNPNGLPP